MRNIFILCGLILAAAAFYLWKTTQLPTVAGEFAGAPKTEVAALIEHPKDFLNKTVRVEGEVRQQCKAMGCYFFFAVGEKQLRIDLEQIAMNAPMREGHPASVEGQVVPYLDGYQLLASAVEFH